MKNSIKWLALGTALLSAQQAQAIIIELDYSYDTNNFFQDSARQNVLQSAANFFEGQLNDSLTAINSTANNNFTAVFFDPSSGSNTSLSNFSVATDTLRVFAGGRNLGGSVVGRGGPGGFNVTGSQAFVDNAGSRVQVGETDGNNATDFAPWGGSITFNTESSWYFDLDISSDQDISGNDFYTVALHEFAHLLGFGLADSWDNQVAAGSFFGSASMVANAGQTVLLHDDLSHWANGTNSLVGGVNQQAAMTPTIITGTRKHFTELDLAALEDIGWEVSAIPVPAAVYLFAPALFGLSVFRKKST